jgi:hypothetical protein
LIAKNPPRSKKSYAGTIDKALTNHSAALWLEWHGATLRNSGQWLSCTSRRNQIMTHTYLAAALTLARVLLLPFAASAAVVARSFFSNGAFSIEASVQPRTGWKAIQSITLNC